MIFSKGIHFLSIIISMVHLHPSIDAFSPSSLQHHSTLKTTSNPRGISHFAEVGHRQSTALMAQYGPTETSMDSSWEQQDDARIEEQRIIFKKLLHDVIHVNDRDHLPRLCTQNIDLIVNMRGYEGVDLMKEAQNEAEASGDQALIDNTTAAIQYIVYFTETFVTEAKKLDDQNKHLLGEIIKCMIGRELVEDNDNDIPIPSAREREESLDSFLRANRSHFTPGFLRHVEGECQRVMSAPTMTKESSKLHEILRVIQTRIIEELGQDLGEGAQVLGQLLGYDDQNERLAVLEAGLTVRGIDFAKELAGMTTEALNGFLNVPGGADPKLVQIIQEIHDRIIMFIMNAEQA
mmetsp:Transcript_6051/g.7695  ORF Transcript_6051/g.7695 Transcript_6051/m.7695 type:complete len:349 (+) Transcript_6051:21-1067(+)